jgi:hypothetical protein
VCFVFCKRVDVEVFKINDKDDYVACPDCIDREIVAKRECESCKAKLGNDLIRFSQGDILMKVINGKMDIVETSRYVCERCSGDGAL